MKPPLFWIRDILVGIRIRG